MGVARIRPAGETSGDVPAGLEGVVVAETTIGDVRGQEGFFHYRQYSAVDLAEQRSLEDVWHLLFRGELPDAAASKAFADEVRGRRTLPPGLSTLLPALSRRGAPLDVLRTAVSVLASELGWRPTHDIDAEELADQALGLCAVVPTILAAAHRLREGNEPVEPRADLGSRPTTSTCSPGRCPRRRTPGPIEQYMILTIDHGFNASTFTARVVDLTGADLGAAIVAAIGALSGPLHGGAPSRALDMLDAIGTPDRADAYIRHAVENGERIMGFGHRVYKTEDPRSLLLRSVTERLGGPLVGVLAGGRADRGGRAGRAEAGTPPLRQRRVLRGRGHVHLRHPPRDVHSDLRGRTHHRLVHPRDGAGGAQPPHPPRRPLRGPSAAAAGAAGPG